MDIIQSFRQQVKDYKRELNYFENVTHEGDREVSYKRVCSSIATINETVKKAKREGVRISLADVITKTN